MDTRSRKYHQQRMQAAGSYPHHNVGVGEKGDDIATSNLISGEEEPRWGGEDEGTDRTKKPYSRQHRYRGLLFVVISLFMLPPTIFVLSTLRFGTMNLRVSQTLLSDEEGLQSEPTLGGLISPEADKEHCKSRGFIHRFRRASRYLPSPYLSARLRQYEAMHKRCGPGSEAFNKAANMLILDDANNMTNDIECKYVVWKPQSGLGNRIISIASTFVYALLTNRVLLLDGGPQIPDLFCEPFPESSWILPLDFPYSTHALNETSPLRFGLYLETTRPSNASQRETNHHDFSPPLVYLNLIHSYNFYDKLVFCEEEQGMLTDVPWLFLRSNFYFVPFFYLYVPQFREELGKLFPNPETLFHHIGRYLFFPSDSVWSWIAQFYQAYLADVSERVGVQIRVMAKNPKIVSMVSNQVFACAFDNQVLPNVTEFEAAGASKMSNGYNPFENNPTRRSLAMLITSLDGGYVWEMREKFLDGIIESGEVVKVYQPSHEGFQQIGNMAHEKKAWAEICLLSFSDKLITSSWSTFGYVAQGLAGIRPWVLKRGVGSEMVDGDPTCSRSNSMDPCFHLPPNFDCRSRVAADPTKVLPFIKHCEDVVWGLKLFNDNTSPP